MPASEHQVLTISNNFINIAFKYLRRHCFLTPISGINNI